MPLDPSRFRFLCHKSLKLVGGCCCCRPSFSIMLSGYKSDTSTSYDNGMYRPKQEHALLEEWPSSNPSPPTPKKEVKIATYSEQRVFDNSSYRRRKSYKSEELEQFKEEASLEARKVFDLISRFPMQTGAAIQSVIGLGLLHQEQLVGLEHLVTPKTAYQHIKGRKAHVALVLKAQDILREGNVSDDMALSKLAKVASTSSSKHVTKAKIRAEMNLQADEVDHGSNVRRRKSRGGMDSLSASFSTKVSISSKDEESSTASPGKHTYEPAKIDDASIAASSSTSTSSNTQTKSSKVSSFALVRRNAPVRNKRRTAAHAA